jgi:predicted porin
MFNNVAYFGVSSPTWGTFTMGRQSSLTSDLAVNYDALSGSNAWSLITFEGATGGGGVTEDRIYDNSYEYRLNVGPVRFAGIVQAPNGGNSATALAYEGDVGFDYAGLSMDFVGGHINDALSVSTTMTTAQVNSLTQNQANIAGPVGPGYAIPCSLGCLAGVVSDNTVFAVAGKYTMGPWKLYGGYEHIQFAAPSNPLLPGAFAEGGYNVAFANNNFYASNRNQDVFWAGVKYAATPTLDLIGAYYGVRQHYFTVGNGQGAGGNGTFVSFPGTGAPGFGATQAAQCAVLGTLSPGCAGSVDMFSLALDWRFARHFDLYAGVSYSQKSGGLANGYVLTAANALIGTTCTGLNTPAGCSYNSKNTVSIFDPGVGLRYQF